MAVHVTAGIYGQVWGQPPYIGTTSQDAFTNFTAWSAIQSISLPTTGTIFHPVSPGQQVGNSTTNYIYSVIEVQPTGLNQQSTKYACGSSVATLASAAS